jgi:hypothetical protein
MFVDGQFRRLAIYAWSIALINLAVSLILTPILGLEGVAIGTAVGNAAMIPFFVSYALTKFGLTVGDLARSAWKPGYITGAGLAAALGLVRLLVPLDSAVVVLGVAAAGVLASWLVIYFFWFDVNERGLLLRLLPGRSAEPTATA